MKLFIKRDLSGSVPAKLFINTMAARLGMKTYEPTPYLGIVNRFNGKRSEASFTRWNLIKKHMKDLKPKSVVDFGCSEGFFVMEAAKETGALSLGIDADVNRLLYATHQQVFAPDLQNVGFMRAEMDFELFEKLPKFDVTICLSVLHHVLYEHGYDYALEFVKNIRSKTGKALFFETGNSNEKSMKWASKLPDMGKDHDKWVEQFLQDAGFKTVRLIGKTPSYTKETERGLFIAKP